MLYMAKRDGELKLQVVVKDSTNPVTLPDGTTIKDGLAETSTTGPITIGTHFKFAVEF